MTSNLFLVALLASFFICDASWTDPVILMRLKYGLLTDACIDSNNHTLLLIQKTYISKDLIALTYVNNDTYFDNIRQVMKNQGEDYSYPRNKIVCRRNANNDVMVFSVTKPAGGAGILAEARRDGIFVEKYRRESITAGSLLFINSTEMTILFLANKTSLWFTTRPAGSETFTSEKIIYTKDSFHISDVTSAISKRRDEFFLHVAVRVGKQIYYFLGANNGARWEEPYLFENVAACDDTKYHISFVANYDFSTTTFLTYMNAASNLLSLVWTSNSGDTWAQPVNTGLRDSEFTSVGLVYSIDGKPALFLSDNRGDYVISKWWTENRIEFSSGSSPLLYPVYSLQASSPSLLQGFGRNYKDWWIYIANQTD